MSQEHQTLAVTPRELTGKKVHRLRKQGFVPAVLYGYGVKPTNMQVSARDFEAMYKAAGKTTLVALTAENGRSVQVFVQEVQRHPISKVPLHIDFHAVNLLLEITTEVPVVLTGEPVAVHNNVGVLLHGLDTVSVRALPADLPHQLDISVEDLAEVDQALHVSDLPTDGNYEIVTEPTEMIAKIVAQQLEPEVEELPEEEAADTAEGEPATATE